MLRRRPPSRQNLASDGFSGWQLGHFMLGCHAPRKASCTSLWRRMGPSKPIAGTEEDQGPVRAGDAGIVADKITVDNQCALTREASHLSIRQFSAAPRQPGQDAPRRLLGVSGSGHWRPTLERPDPVAAAEAARVYLQTSNLGYSTTDVSRISKCLRERYGIPIDSWRGIGTVERGMGRPGLRHQLTRYDERG